MQAASRVISFELMLATVSAAFLLREVHAFSTAETADALDATPVQVKNWIRQARRTMEDR